MQKDKLKSIKKILISRTDGIGDVILTLPLAGYIKKQNPDIEILFLGNSYTKDVVTCSENIDVFIDCDFLKTLSIKQAALFLKDFNIDVVLHVFPDKNVSEICKNANIPIRVGTTNRFFHWLYCNKLVILSRRNSNLHEAELNFFLLKPILKNFFVKKNILHNYYAFNKIKPLQNKIFELIDKQKTNIILHPKSNGSSKEWKLEHYKELIKKLEQTNCHIFITGAGKSTEEIINHFPNSKFVTNLAGLMTLSELISFIAKCDVLISASTGPLHIAAACGIKALGMYPSKKPINAGRWAPLGVKATIISNKKDCNYCRKTQECLCMNDISPEMVFDKIFDKNKIIFE